ncbi:archaeal proteasome endopeptidase complex subunit alpha [Candidatus Woesearchaeota archaeon]|nr:archaeal proteasome endopeptidase complex subunit alpha [Candidatus Woesearchaeota archaeon]
MQTTSMQHQMMGYDRASTMFSPDGRLLQVEYAKKTVRQGTSALGLVCKDGVLLVADKRILEKFIVPQSIEKVYQIDEHIAATASGILSDGRILIERAQILSQQHRVIYDSPIDIHGLVKEICDIKQMYTQVGGARPFGVSILFGGIDNQNPRLFVTDPTGIYFEYKATAIGEAETEIKELLYKRYRESITIDEGIKLSIDILKQVLGKGYDLERVDGVFIKISDKQFQRLRKDYIKKVIKE